MIYNFDNFKNIIQIFSIKSDKDSIWYIANTLLNSLIFLTFTYFVLTKLKIEETNLWFLFITSVSFSQLVNLGFGNTMTRYISYCVSGVSINDISKINQNIFIKKNDNFNKNEFVEIFFLGKKIFIILTFLFFLILQIIFFLYLTKSFEIYNFENEIVLSWLFLSFSQGIVFYLKYYKYILEGAGKVYEVNYFLFMLTSVFFIISTVMLIFSNITFSKLVIFYNLIFLISFILFFFFSQTQLKKLNLKFNLKKKYGINANLVIKDSIKIGFASISSNIVNNLTSLLIVKWLPLNISTSYLLTTKLFEFYNLLISSLFQSKLASFSYHSTKDQLKKFKLILKKLDILTILITIFFSIILILFVRDLLFFIRSNANLLPDTYLFFFIIVSFTSRWIASRQFILLTKNLIITHYLSLLYLILYFFSFLILISYVDVFAVPYSIIFANFFLALVILYFFRKFLYI